MPAPLTLTIYCVLILLASLLGGWLPMRVRLTHRRMELALSFVSGVMLGIALLHLLPHAVHERELWLEHEGAHPSIDAALHPSLLSLLAGFLAMFLLERFVCFHHHDTPTSDAREDGRRCEHDHAHDHALTWTGAAIGLTIHTLVAGIALAAAVSTGGGAHGAALAGLGMFFVIFLHKPFDALTIITLMSAADRSRRAMMLTNILFALLIPLGVLLFHAGLGSGLVEQHLLLSLALSFSAGMFICIALSDLLPELQFHSHDRIKLSVALLLGLLLAWGVATLEEAGHEHDEETRHEHVETGDSTG